MDTTEVIGPFTPPLRMEDFARLGQAIYASLMPAETVTIYPVRNRVQLSVPADQREVSFIVKRISRAYVPLWASGD